VLVSSYAPDREWNGHTIAELAQAQRKDPVTLVIDMIHAAGPNIGVIVTAMTEPDLAAILAHPNVLICSDGSPGRHPRGYNAFPRVLAKYVRADRVVPLSEAIAKMTGRSAKQLGFTDRGTIAAGKKADITIFDAATIADRGTPENPSQSPVGVRFLVVNGQVVLDAGRATAARPGRGLKRQTP
jgi:N-acyl-D-amino-acid deacylase